MEKSFKIYRYTFGGEIFDTLRSDYLKELVKENIFNSIKDGSIYKSKNFIYTRKQIIKGGEIK